MQATAPRLTEPFDHPGARGFEEAFTHHHEAVLAYALRRTSSRSDAEDVTAETFAIAWRRWDERRGVDLPWLYGVARKVLANTRRSERRRRSLDDRVATEPTAHSPDHSGAVLMRRTLLAALSRLSEPDREAIFLTEWECLPAASAARVVGCSTPTFHVRMHRARRRLLTELELEWNETPPAGRLPAASKEAGS